MQTIRRVYVAFMAAVLLGGSYVALAQTASGGSGVKAAFLVRESRPLKASVVTAEQMLAGQGLKAAKAQVVGVGPALKDLEKGSKAQKMLQSAMSKGVEIVACEMAMKQEGIKKDQLMPGVKTVPNGFTQIFILEKEGWETLVL